MNPGSDMSCACASSLIGRLPVESSAITCRRVRSESAAKRLSSSSSEYLTIRFSIRTQVELVNHLLPWLR
jgi:hypothetical protein